MNLKIALRVVGIGAYPIVFIQLRARHGWRSMMQPSHSAMVFYVGFAVPLYIPSHPVMNVGQSMQAFNEEELMQRAGKITGKSAVDLLHVIMYGAQIRTVQNGEPCFYRPPEDAEGWTWPLIEARPVEPVRRLTRKDYIKALMRARRRGISERQLRSYDTRVRREKSTIARAIDELDNLIPPSLELT